MKILLRDTAEGLYFKCPNHWTEDPNQALDFRFIDHALKYVEVWGLKGVELAFAFDDFQEVTGMPLQQAALQYAAA